MRKRYIVAAVLIVLALIIGAWWFLTPHEKKTVSDTNSDQNQSVTNPPVPPVNVPAVDFWGSDSGKIAESDFFTSIIKNSFSSPNHIEYSVQREGSGTVANETFSFFYKDNKTRLDQTDTKRTYVTQRNLLDCTVTNNQPNCKALTELPNLLKVWTYSYGAAKNNILSIKRLSIKDDKEILRQNALCFNVVFKMYPNQTSLQCYTMGGQLLYQQINDDQGNSTTFTATVAEREVSDANIMLPAVQ